MTARYQTCTRCGTYKPADEFSKDHRYVSGLKSWCKGCVREHSKAAYVPRKGVS